MDWTALWLSVRLATATTMVLLVAGVPIAYWIVFSPQRWKFLVEAVVAMPLVLPPTVLGFYVLMAIGPLSPVGRLYATVAGHGLPFTFEGLLVASVLYSLPFAVQPFSAEFASVDRRLLEASWSLGVSRVATFRRIVLPLSGRSSPAICRRIVVFPAPDGPKSTRIEPGASATSKAGDIVKPRVPATRCWRAWTLRSSL